MVGCAAVNCSNNSRHGFRLFIFPKDEDRRRIWINNCRRDKWNPSKYSRLCEVHFEADQFENSRADGWKRLKPNAIPTLFNVPNPPPLLTIQRKKRDRSSCPEYQPRRKKILGELGIEVGNGHLTCTAASSAEQPDDISHEENLEVAEAVIEPSIENPSANIYPTEAKENGCQAPFINEKQILGSQINALGRELSDVTPASSGANLLVVSSFPLAHLNPQTVLKQEGSNCYYYEPRASFVTSPYSLHLLIPVENDGDIKIPNNTTYHQGKDALVIPDPSLADVHYQNIASSLPQVKIESESENEQHCEQPRSTAVDYAVGFAIKQEFIEENIVDHFSMDHAVNQMKSSKVEDGIAEMNERKSSFSRNAIVEKTKNSYLHENISDKDTIKLENMCDKTSEAVDEKKGCSEVDNNKKQKLTHNNTCTLCGNIFRTNQACLWHIWHKHTVEQLYMCELCGKSFKHMYKLKYHRQVAHSGERPYSCNVCEKTFKVWNTLKKHQAYLHSNKTPFSCDVCGKTFRTQDILKKHKACHLNERPHSCDICGKTFKSCGAVKRHKTSLHSIKVETCV